MIKKNNSVRTIFSGIVRGGRQIVFFMEGPRYRVREKTLTGSVCTMGT